MGEGGGFMERLSTELDLIARAFARSVNLGRWARCKVCGWRGRVNRSALETRRAQGGYGKPYSRVRYTPCKRCGKRALTTRNARPSDPGRLAKQDKVQLLLRALKNEAST